MILVHADPLDNQLQVAAVELVLVEYVVEYLERELCRAVYPDDGISSVNREVDLILYSRDSPREIVLQFVVGFLKHFLLVGVLHDVADALTLGRFQLPLQVEQDFLKVFLASVLLLHVLRFLGEVGV